MDDASVSKWNARYAYSGAGVPPPAQVLARGVQWLPEPVRTLPAVEQGEALLALDLACGKAGNGEFLAEKGFIVSAWDSSDQVIDAVRSRKASRITDVRLRDVSRHPPEPESFDVIVVARFLDRSICPAISKALKPGGVLFYQTFLHGLSNPDFMLESNELPELFHTLQVLEYQEPERDDSGRSEARLIARRNQ